MEFETGHSYSAASASDHQSTQVRHVVHNCELDVRTLPLFSHLGNTQVGSLEVEEVGYPGSRNAKTEKFHKKGLQQIW